MKTLGTPPPISDLANSINVSGIRRVFELGASLSDPIDLSIGQPDFPVPSPIKDAAIEAIQSDKNGYTLTQGGAEIRQVIGRHLSKDCGWDVEGEQLAAMVTSGTSGGLLLAFLTLLNPDDEVIIPDPYFVIYPVLASVARARSVLCDTYPDFRMTAGRVEPLLTDRTRALLVNSPGNPTGVTLSGAEMRDLVELCDSRGVVLISDEIYDQFTYGHVMEDERCPSPARFSERVVLIRGFGKTYGCTGWRMGYAAGPTPIIRTMSKLQQFTFVCAPSMAQAGCAASFDVDMSQQVADYDRKRKMVVEAFDGVANLVEPGGAFYAFVEVPPALGLSAGEFVERAIERNVLIIPGNVFSERDTHFRISYATSDDKLAAGLATLRQLMT